MPKRETETFFNLCVKPADGSTPIEHLYKDLEAAQRIEQEAESQGAAVEITRGQAFTITTAENWEDIPNVIADSEVALGLFNYGAKMCQQINRHEHMKNANWRGKDGDWDLVAEIQSLRAGRKARKRQKGELAKERREFKKMYARRHPEAPMPSDNTINQLLDEMLEKRLANDAEESDLAFGSPE
jgi:hypothetical protein